MTIRTPAAINLASERVAIGDTVAFVEKINRLQDKMEAWTGQDWNTFAADMDAVVGDVSAKQAAASAAATNAASSASSASGSASTASTAATNAASSASSASGSALTASTAATNAASSASSASGSASTASTAATNAASSAAAALASKNQTQAIADSLSGLGFLESMLALQGRADIVVRYTAKGQPCFFYRLPAFNMEDVFPGGEIGTGLHPAFIRNGVTKPYVLISCYEAAEVSGEYVSQPNRTPAVSKTYDQELAMAAATGSGFRLMSNWDWAAMCFTVAGALTAPLGNTDWGRSHSLRVVTAVRTSGHAPGVQDGSGLTLTGSGGALFQLGGNEGMPIPLHDVIGNSWTRVSGLQLRNNVFYLAPDNGSYAEAAYLNTGVATYSEGNFKDLTGYTGDAAMLKKLKAAMCIKPAASTEYAGYFWKDGSGDRVPLRGGGWDNASYTGLGALNLNNARSNTSWSVGVRLAFWDL